MRCLICVRELENTVIVLTLSQEAKLDPVYRAAIVAQNRAYNALPQVQEHAQEYRRGPVGYPMKVINDAIRSVHAHLRHLFPPI